VTLNNEDERAIWNAAFGAAYVSIMYEREDRLALAEPAARSRETNQVYKDANLLANKAVYAFRGDLYPCIPVPKDPS
jgi:hypothetical protein